MSETKSSEQTDLGPDRGRLGRWILAAVFGIYIELLADVLRHFAREMRNPDFHFEPEALFWVVLFFLLILVPIYWLSRTSESLVDRKTERIIFLIALLVSAFFLPPLSWFAHLASGH